uniref:Uncharacterized protein n=1 Tax=Panagrolaimus sp. ES5 TaxID=591445 RepID=A0AC34GP34_9BILA
MQSFKPGKLAYLKNEVDVCPIAYRLKLEDIIEHETNVWSKAETYYLLAYAKQELWENINYVNVAIKMNLKLPEISLFRPAGCFSPEKCQERVKEVLDTFANTVDRFGEKDILEQLSYAIQYIVDKDTQLRIKFFSNQKNKEYVQMFVDGNVKAEHKEAVAKAAKTFFSFIPEFINTENLGVNRPFRELEENLGDLPISLSTTSSAEFPRPDVVMRSIDATSLSPRSASVSPPMETEKPREDNLKPSTSSTEIRLPTPEPMEVEEAKPVITQKSPPLPSASEASEDASPSSPAKRVVGRPRSIETSPKKVVSPKKEPSTERKPQAIIQDLPPTSSSSPKKRKSQTPRRSESTSAIKEDTPSSPLTPKVRPNPPVFVQPKTELPPREARRRKTQTQMYTPPASPAPKTPHIETPEDSGSFRDEIVLSSDASRASSRLSASLQPSALSSAVPSARSSEERSKTDSRQSNIPFAIKPSTTSYRNPQTQLSITNVLSKSSKRATTVAPYQVRRSAKLNKYDAGCQTASPFNVANGATWTSDNSRVMSEAMVTLFNETKRPFTRRQAVALNLNLNKRDLDKLYPTLSSSKYYPLQKCINTSAKNVDLQNPVCFIDKRYPKIVKKPMDGHTISTLISKDQSVGLLEIEMLWALAAANSVAAKADKNQISNTKEFLYQATESIQKARAFEQDKDNM